MAQIEHKQKLDRFQIYCLTQNKQTSILATKSSGAFFYHVLHHIEKWLIVNRGFVKSALPTAFIFHMYITCIR